MKFDQDVDALGLLCPLPVLKAAKRLRSMDKGQVLRLKADDPAARIDVAHFCNEQGFTLIGTPSDLAPNQFYIQK